MLLLLATGCVPSTLTIGTDSDTTIVDTAVVDTAVVDTAVVDTAVVDTANTKTTPDLDFSTWTGHRTLSADDCEETIEEVGERLDEDWVQYPLLEEFCDDCDHWYVIDITPAWACGTPVETHSFRGLRLQNDTPEIYWMGDGATDGGLFALAEWQGERLIYEVLLPGPTQHGHVQFEPLLD